MTADGRAASSGSADAAERAPAARLVPPDTAAVVVRLGAAEFGIPIAAVRQVLRPPPFTRVPFAAPDLCGVAAVRGSILPVIDLGLRLGLAAARRPGALVVVSLAGAPEPHALLVDSVTSLLDAATADPLETPGEVEVTLPPGWVSGTVRAEADRIVVILNLQAVLAGRAAPGAGRDVPHAPSPSESG